MKENKTFKGHYVIVDPKGEVNYTTLSCERKWCIDYFLKYSIVTWNDCKKIGYKCIKVDVTFLPHKK